MGFFKKLFGGGEPKPYVDKNGLYFHVRCDNCQGVVQLRIDKRHDLNNDAGNFIWHKTITDSQCFHPMPAVVQFDSNHQVTNADIQGGHHISEAVYKTAIATKVSEPDNNPS